MSKKFYALKILNVRNCRALSFNCNSNMKASNAVVSNCSVAVSYSSPKNSVPRSIIGWFINSISSASSKVSGFADEVKFVLPCCAYEFSFSFYLARDFALATALSFSESPRLVFFFFYAASSWAWKAARRSVSFLFNGIDLREIRLVQALTSGLSSGSLNPSILAA